MKRLLALLMLTVPISALGVTLSLGTCTSTMTATQYAAFSSCTLAATGGTTPYTYSWVVYTDNTFTALPEGMSINSSTGAISSSLVAGQGGYQVQFKVVDAAAASATNTITFNITADNTLTACGGTLFPNSIFHARVDSLPVDTSPAAPIPSVYQSSSLHVFWGAAAQPYPNGIPFIKVPSGQGLVTVTTRDFQSYFTSGPIPPYAPPEGTSNAGPTSPPLDGADRHVAVVETTNPCSLWEIYQGVLQQPGNSWSGASNALWSNTNANAMLPQGNGSTDAAGLPVTPLTVNADEVIGTGTPSSPNGSVQHPIRFTTNNSLNYYVWPATDKAGVGSCSGGYEDSNGMLLQGAGAPASCTTSGPMGEIYRLKASVTNPSCAATSPQAAIIITGMRRYGIILADNGTTGGLIGTPDARWNDSDLACLTNFTLANFEPVNVSSLAKDLTANYNGSGFSAPVTTYNVVGGLNAPTKLSAVKIQGAKVQ